MRSDKMGYTVYLHRNKINQKVYIGITSQDYNVRWRAQGQGYRQQPKFYYAIEKYGWDNFEHIILFTNLSKEVAEQKEIELIAIYDAINNGYNVYPGGNLINHTEKTKQKLSQIMTGKKHSELVKQKMREHTPKMPVLCIETNIIYDSIRAASRDTGIDPSSISRCCRGQQITAGKKHWQFINQKTNDVIKKDQRLQPVQCITTGKKYISLAEAARDTNSDVSNIKKVCDGKYKTTNKLKWKYITNEEYYL